VATVLATIGFLLTRLAPDVRGKPIFLDEVVAGLVSSRPLGKVVDTVLSDRGGAPAHFVLAHLALAADPSVDSLRWLSIVFAVGTIPVTYDLGRRLGGRLAGATACGVIATSDMLGVYGSFGRMYALFAFTGRWLPICFSGLSSAGRSPLLRWPEPPHGCSRRRTPTGASSW
jgi:uncharacterized membrane protein